MYVEWKTEFSMLGTTKFLTKRIKINMKLHSQPILILQCDAFPIEIVNINMSEQHLQYVSVSAT